MRHGLFFLLLHSICITRSICIWRPITGSNLFFKIVHTPTETTKDVRKYSTALSHTEIWERDCVGNAYGGIGEDYLFSQFGQVCAIFVKHIGLKSLLLKLLHCSVC